ncbi:hypothetical protein EYF80_047566 [Liparis tanakae]|uniref:Uncharacterized protein n=1 Tax=Liparis tanakae TaxID=230148 RepID=A0A4Z2FMN1_9TELE|nr:hypothetical protein EYF80_047566 [Liparis tanakae]
MWDRADAHTAIGRLICGGGTGSHDGSPSVSSQHIASSLAAAEEPLSKAPSTLWSHQREQVQIQRLRPFFQRHRHTKTGSREDECVYVLTVTLYSDGMCKLLKCKRRQRGNKGTREQGNRKNSEPLSSGSPASEAGAVLPPSGGKNEDSFL